MNQCTKTIHNLQAVTRTHILSSHNTTFHAGADFAPRSKLSIYSLENEPLLDRFDLGFASPGFQVRFAWIEEIQLEPGMRERSSSWNCLRHRPARSAMAILLPSCKNKTLGCRGAYLFHLGARMLRTGLLALLGTRFSTNGAPGIATNGASVFHG